MSAIEYTPQGWTCEHGVAQSWDTTDCDCVHMPVPERPQWTTEQLLVNVVALLSDIHLQLQRMNSAERSGSVSSVEVKTSTRGEDVVCKAYTGSSIEEAEEQALASYVRMKLRVKELNEQGVEAFAAELARRNGG